ncbi:hypothetical protein Tco_0539348 [Tanacetum coccineum]
MPSYCLANGINIDYASIFWEDIIIKLNKRHREKVVPYTRFLSLLMMHKMKEGYRDGEVTPYPTQVFSVNNWALKPNQLEDPLFIDHMLAIYNAADPVIFKAPRPSSNAERVPQGTKPEAKPGYKKHSTSSKQPSVSSKEATKGGSSKAPTSSKISHLKRKKESNSTIDSNPSQTSASTLVVVKMHKEDQQATGGPTSLGVTSEARANPQLSSGMSAFNLNEPIYSAFFIIHSESASGDDDSTISIAEVDPRKSAPSDFVPQQQGMNEWTKNTLYDHLFAGASSNARQVEEDEALRIIKLEDLAKLVSSVQASFKDLDSPEDDLIIVVDDSDEDEEVDEVYATINVETEDTSHKLELEKNKAEAEDALLKAQPSFPNIGQLNELLVKSLQTEFSKILSAHDFSSSLLTELKDLPSKFNELTEEVKGLKKQSYITIAELKTLQWELPAEFISVPSQVEMVQAKLKTLDALPKEAKKESTNIDSDDETHVTGSMVETSRIKKLKKFDFITEDGKHIHLTEEQINQ